MIIIPLALAALGLYLNSTQVIEPKLKSLLLNKDIYSPMTKFAIHNGTDSNLDSFLNLDTRNTTLYDGNFSYLLDIAPHMVALNVNVFEVERGEFSVTAIYNDTFQHSLPIVVNFINNALFKLLGYGDNVTSFKPIEVSVNPFQQTSQPEEFNIGIFASTTFMGMIFVLLPVSLAVDVVYDREVCQYQFLSWVY